MNEVLLLVVHDTNIFLCPFTSVLLNIRNWVWLPSYVNDKRKDIFTTLHRVLEYYITSLELRGKKWPKMYDIKRIDNIMEEIKWAERERFGDREIIQSISILDVFQITSLSIPEQILCIGYVYLQGNEYKQNIIREEFSGIKHWFAIK